MFKLFSYTKLFLFRNALAYVSPVHFHQLTVKLGRDELLVIVYTWTSVENSPNTTLNQLVAHLHQLRTSLEKVSDTVKSPVSRHTSYLLERAPLRL